jgi:hypothetical protein
MTDALQVLRSPISSCRTSTDIRSAGNIQPLPVMNVQKRLLFGVPVAVVEVGSHLQAVKTAREDFSRLAERIAKACSFYDLLLNDLLS